ncbi:hypothetical protein Clacol_001490 [Clathrus columnatus]|uniref:Uncharacterized protein n=1 Tax=Clathrus columnatus TaxID=1419009 RepID=A0AAV4ZZD6_9AGAM|nr:hypothetical protein Clacol_001490 [Clathrus columnatus]
MNSCISRLKQLQSRIRQLEQERMDLSNPKDTLPKPKSSSMSRLPTIIPPPSSSSKPHTPCSTVPSKRSPKVPALISNSSQRILLRSPPESNDEKLVSGIKSKMLPKRGICDVKDLTSPLGSGKPSTMPHRPMSPSRPSATILATSKQKNSEKKIDLQSNKPPSTTKLPVPAPRPNKRTLFSSKLDSLVLTSKLLPVSSPPRTKLSSKSAESSTVSILLASPGTGVSRNRDSVILDSPPNKGTIKPRHMMRIKKKSPTSPNQANDAQAERSTSDDKKIDLHVSFSNALDEKKIDGPSTKTGVVEPTNKLWGSWNKIRPSLQVPTIHENPDGSSPAPSMHSTDDGKRTEKRRSLAPQYLRSLISGSNESMSDSSNLVLRRSNSISGHPVLFRSSESDNAGPEISSTKKKLNPLLVGAPTLPKARLESEAEVGRVNSLRSSGKWANRSRILSADFTRRRTIHPAHPMFSFERPGSAGAMSAVSSRDEQQGTVTTTRSSEVKKQRRATMPAKPIGNSAPGDVSGQTAIDGTAGSDPGAWPSRGTLLRPLLGAQTLGRFDFEASTSTSILPRRIERGSRLWATTSPTKISSSSIRLSKLNVLGSNDTVNPESYDDKRFREYTEFCKELRAMLGDDDWSLFMNYARRFDLHVLSPDVLLQRVKKLIDGRRNIDLVMRAKMYERFSKIVHDSIRD